MKKEIINIIDNTFKWVKNYSDKYGDLGDYAGLCGIASARLYLDMRKNNYNTELHYADSNYGEHIFNIYQDYLIDLTAQQFRNQTINHLFNDDDDGYIICKLSNAKKSFWKSSKQFVDNKHLLSFQTKEGWPMDQRAYFKKLNWSFNWAIM